MKIILSLILIFLPVGCGVIKPKISPEQVKEQTKTVINLIQDKPEWLFPADLCPAEIMPSVEKNVGYPDEKCNNNPLECLDNCRKEDANACYALALHLQEQSSTEQIEAEPLFWRSCKFGIVSGCTNNAAGRLNSEPENKQIIKCAADTFEKTCEKNDAWGCTMYAVALSQGQGRERNFDEALKVLTKSCRHGANDAACQNAKRLREQIEKLRQQEN